MLRIVRIVPAISRRLAEQTLSLIKQAGGRLNLPSNNMLDKVFLIAMNPDFLVCTILNGFFSFSYHNDQQVLTIRPIAASEIIFVGCILISLVVKVLFLGMFCLMQGRLQTPL